MSFCSELIKRKKELKSCQTVVTSPTGNKYLERLGSETGQLLEKCPGFVVDEKLDLEIAQILDYLYLSSQDAAQDLDLLETKGISHVLSIGVDLPNADASGRIKFVKVELLDEPGSDLRKAFERSIDFIDKSRRENESNKILVHCNAGYSRAPTVVIGYLMKTFGYSLNESLNLVKGKRDVKPNVGFMEQLRKMETDLRQGDDKTFVTK